MTEYAVFRCVGPVEVTPSAWSLGTMQFVGIMTFPDDTDPATMMQGLCPCVESVQSTDTALILLGKNNKPVYFLTEFSEDDRRRLMGGEENEWF